MVRARRRNPVSGCAKALLFGGASFFACFTIRILIIILLPYSWVQKNGIHRRRHVDETRVSLPDRITAPNGDVYTVVYEEDMTRLGADMDVFGALDMDDKIIYIWDGVPYPVQMETLIHELIHIADYDAVEEGWYPGIMSEEQTEVVAGSLFDMLASSGLLVGIPAAQYIEWRDAMVDEALRDS